MTLLTFTNVILRYVFNNSIIWSLEVVTCHVRMAGAVWHFLRVQSHGPSGCRCGHEPMFQSLQEDIALIAGVLCIVYGG